MEGQPAASPEKTKEEPDLGRILLATFIGILLLGGVTYAAYRFSQSKTTSGDCSSCVAGTYIRFDGWDQNNDGIINNCNEACRAHFGPDCNGNAFCSNPGSTDPGACCSCQTASGDPCFTLPTPTGIIPTSPPTTTPTTSLPASPTGQLIPTSNP